MNDAGYLPKYTPISSGNSIVPSYELREFVINNEMIDKRKELLEGMPPGHKLITTIKCGDGVHRISLAPNGQLAMIDHGSLNSTFLIKALTNEKIPCIEYIQAARLPFAATDIYSRNRVEEDLHYDDGLKQLNKIAQERRTIRALGKYNADPLRFKTFNERYAACLRDSLYNDLQRIINLNKGDSLSVSCHVKSGINPGIETHVVRSSPSTGANIYLAFKLDPMWLGLHVKGRTVLKDALCLGPVKMGEVKGNFVMKPSFYITTPRKEPLMLFLRMSQKEPTYRFEQFIGRYVPPHEYELCLYLDPKPKLNFDKSGKPVIYRGDIKHGHANATSGGTISSSK